jgi:hypothetical protein
LAPGELRTLDETGPPLVEYANQSIEDIAEGIQRTAIRSRETRTRMTTRPFGRIGTCGERRNT